MRAILSPLLAIALPLLAGCPAAAVAGAGAAHKQIGAAATAVGHSIGGGGGSSSKTTTVGDTATITGSLTFEKLTVSATTGLDNGTARTTRPVRFADVELVAAATGVAAQATASDASGNYKFVVARGATQFFVRASTSTARTDFLNFSVVDVAGGAIYTMQGATFTANQAAITQNVTLAASFTTTPKLVAGAFNIFDIVTQTHELARKTRSDFDTVIALTTNKLEVQWKFGNSAPSSAFTPTSLSLLGIIIMGGQSGTESQTDTDMFDDYVIAHEAAHYLVHVLSADASPGGAHANGDRLVPSLAYSEGLANFIGAVVQASATGVDTTGFNATSTRTVANHETLQVNGVAVTNLGSTNEDSVAAILWDLFDDSSGGVAGTDTDFQAIADSKVLKPAFNFKPGTDWPALDLHLDRLVSDGAVTETSLGLLLTTPHNHGIVRGLAAIYPDVFPILVAVGGGADARNLAGQAAAVGQGQNLAGTHRSVFEYQFRVFTRGQHTVRVTINAATSQDPAAANNLDLFLIADPAKQATSAPVESKGTGALEEIKTVLELGTYVAKVRGATAAAKGDFTFQVIGP